MEKKLIGKPIASVINKINKDLVQEHELSPKMVLIQVGEDPASSYYVQSIIKTAAKLGCEAELLTLAADAGQEELLGTIYMANQNPDIHGIMVQKPLPKGFEEHIINEKIDPMKDIDALNPVNLGLMLMDNARFVPCTPAAVYYLMRYYGIDPAGKNLVILGRSNVVGKPLANMLLWKRAFANATVTVCHSRTKNIEEICQNADILISAIGIAHFVKEEMIKEKAIIIDVGINKIKDASGEDIFVGDVDFEACYDKALALTPVPGGIGRITTAVLYSHLVQSALFARNINKNVDELINIKLSENHEK